MNAMSLNFCGSPAPAPLDPPTAARAWTYGWAISRRTQTPVECSGHYRIVVGQPDQRIRFVLPEFDPRLIQQLATSAEMDGCWLKICAPPAHVCPLLTPAWDVHEPEFLMSAGLVGADAPVAGGYCLDVQNDGATACARVTTPHGELAASGQAAITGPFATFDQIITAEGHRRKGLGRQVMAALSARALELGARQGVLVATEAGATLYHALGWSLVSPVTAASFRQPTNSAN